MPYTVNQVIAKLTPEARAVTVAAVAADGVVTEATVGELLAREQPTAWMLRSAVHYGFTAESIPNAAGAVLALLRLRAPTVNAGFLPSKVKAGWAVPVLPAAGGAGNGAGGEDSDDSAEVGALPADAAARKQARAEARRKEEEELAAALAASKTAAEALEKKRKEEAEAAAKARLASVVDAAKAMSPADQKAVAEALGLKGVASAGDDEVMIVEPPRNSTPVFRPQGRGGETAAAGDSGNPFARSVWTPPAAASNKKRSADEMAGDGIAESLQLLAGNGGSGLLTTAQRNLPTDPPAVSP
jgi:hypothetical protein